MQGNVLAPVTNARKQSLPLLPCAAYSDSSMVAYNVQLAFQELEPIFNDDYTNLDGDSDDSVGF